MKKKTLLVDADIFCHKIGIALEIPIEWDNDHHILYSNDADARNALKKLIDFYMSLTEADDCYFAFTHEKNFRHKVLPSYKANRGSGRKPFSFAALKEYIKENHKVKEIPELEADDVLGILATAPWIKGEKIIASYDKDFKQIPCTLFRPHLDVSDNKLKGPLEVVSEKDADLFFYSQVLIGDTVDNYKGCPGVGEKTAEKLLNKSLTNSEKWDIVVDQFKSKKLTEKDALQQARVARILRYCDFNDKTKKVKLWTPEKKGKKK